MKPTSRTILFFGTDEFSAASLRELLARGYRIGAVVTKPDSQKGRGRKVTKSIVKQIAEVNGIPVWQPLRVDALTEHIKNLTEREGQAPVGVLVSYGKIIPQSIIDLFEPGIINVHPSLLPKYRGPSPIETAILNGDAETGVSIMQLSKEMDAGPVYHQRVVPLLDIETGPQLEQQLAEVGARELCSVLPKIIDGSLQGEPQDDTLASYCQLLTKEDSYLDVVHLSAEAADRKVRALLAYPKTKYTIEGHPVIITGAHVSHTHNTALDLACSDGKYLSIDTLVGPSGKSMDAHAFINGYLTK